MAFYKFYFSILIYLIGFNLICDKFGQSMSSTVPDICTRDIYFCPPYCDCEILADGVEVLCDYTSLVVEELLMPSELPKRTVTFYLRIVAAYPYRYTLKDFTFKGCTQLLNLDIANNNFVDIQTFAFQDLHQLRVLHIEENQLNLTSIAPEVFTFPQLTQLYCRQTRSQFGNTQYGNIYVNLARLTTLALSYLPLAKFGREFFNLTDLTYLKLDSTDDYSMITNNTFEIFSTRPSRVEALILGGWKFYDLEPISFSNFTKLIFLDLSYNSDMGFVNATKSFYGLQFTNITILNLTSITTYKIDHGKFSTFEPFRHLSSKHIRELILNSNGITEIDFQFSKYLPYLERLSLAGNILHITVYLDFVNAFADHEHMVFFDASNQGMQEFSSKNESINKIGSVVTTSLSQANIASHTGKFLNSKFTLPIVRSLQELYLSSAVNGFLAKNTIPEVHIDGNISLRYFDFSHNGLNYFKGPLYFLHTPKVPITVDFSDNILENTKPFFFDNSSAFWVETIYLRNTNFFENDAINFLIGNLINVNKIDLSENDLYYCLQSIDFDKLLHLKSLNLSRNHMDCIPLHLQIPSLFELDLSQNQINTLKYSNFSGLLNLQYLDISQNNIIILTLDNFRGLNRLQFLRMRQNAIREITFDFRYLPNLIALDLSSNKIKDLTEGIFIHLEKLEVLDLSQNSLAFLSFKFDHMKQLKRLDLSGNTLMQMDSRATIALDNIRNATVNLYDNVLDCSCASLDFVLWLPRSLNKVTKWWRLNCNYHQTTKSLQSLNDTIVPTLKIECDSKYWLQASIAVIISFLILLAISIVLYRHRWEVKFCLLKLTWERSRMGNEKLESHEYDAFVVYSARDSSWVRWQLMTHIEEGYGLKLIVAGRDFLGGGNIEERIMDAVQNSRRILLVVSKNFLQSNWTREEMNLARVRAIEEGRNPFVVVILEDIPPSSIPRTLQNIMKRNVYIEWPEAENEQEDFWTRLAASLRQEGCPNTDNQLQIL